MWICSGQTSDEATDSIIEKQIPEVARLNKSGSLKVENIDVFCEKGVFSVEQVSLRNWTKNDDLKKNTRKIFRRVESFGLDKMPDFI